MKKLLLLDFDGVIHEYKTPWTNARTISDGPVSGAIEFIVNAMEYFEVCVYSSRSRQWGGKSAMKRWLLQYLTRYAARNDPDLLTTIDPFNEERSCAEVIAQGYLNGIKFPTKKPAAFLTIDDRCFCFQGSFPKPDDLLKFKPWNKKGI